MVAGKILELVFKDIDIPNENPVFTINCSSTKIVSIPSYPDKVT